VIVKIQKIHLLSQKKSPENAEKDAEQKAGGQRKVKGKSPSLDVYIAGKPSHKGQFVQNKQKHSCQGQCQTQQEKKSADESNIHLDLGGQIPQNRVPLGEPWVTPATLFEPWRTPQEQK
jgi:hypothetical protein